jgi:hypothetical protein
MVNILPGALSSPTNPLTRLKIGAGNYIGMPLSSMAPASGGAIGAYYGRQGMAGGVNQATGGPATQFEAANLLASGNTPTTWWNRTGNTQGNLYANNLQNEYILPSQALTPGTFGFTVNPNVTDPALQMQLGQYTTGLNQQLREARNVAAMRGGRTEGPLGSFNINSSGYNEMAAANPGVLPQFTTAKQYGDWRAAQVDKYNKQYMANKLKGIAGVSAATPLQMPDYRAQMYHEGGRGLPGIAAPGEKTAGQALHDLLGGFR